jgi:thiol-disulfide isomerase/thioredoxin
LLANAEIMVSDRRHQPGVACLNYDFQRFKTQTDAWGRFRFDRVPPGERLLVRLIKMDERGWRHAHTEPVEVKPAGVATVRFGGKGAVVIGQVVPDDPAREIAWQQTEEYKEARRNFRSQSVEFLNAGRFRVTEVEPGDYTLNLHFTRPVPGQSFGGETLGNLSHKVTITEAHTRPDAKPVDLGILDLTLRKLANLGSPAPLFEVKDFNGKLVMLADLHGKYVFLDFWATWCEPCIAKLPHLKQAYAAPKDREDFVVLSLSLDQEIEQPPGICRSQWHGLDARIPGRLEPGNPAQSIRGRRHSRDVSDRSRRKHRRQEHPGRQHARTDQASSAIGGKPIHTGTPPRTRIRLCPRERATGGGSSIPGHKGWTQKRPHKVSLRRQISPCSTRQSFQSRQRKNVAAAQAEPGDALAEVAVERGVRVDERSGSVVLHVAHEGGELGPFPVFETDINLVLMLQEMAGDEFFFAFVHGSITER